MAKGSIGIDIGGTSVKFGLFDRDGRLQEKWQIPTDTSENGSHILPRIAASVNEKMRDLKIRPDELCGAGVGIPGQMSADGLVLLAENIGWVNVPAAQELSDLTGLTIRAENDANLAALGEMWKGSASGCSSMMFITLGTGIGCGIVIDGKILRGADGLAGEIGHMHVEDALKEQCRCGNYGCLEQLASATGIVRLASRELQSSQEPSCLRDTALSAEAVFSAARRKDALACRVAETFGLYLGKALACCACIVNPEVMVIGGGVSKAGEIVLDYIQKYFREYALPACENTPFRLAALGADAGIYGGAGLMMTGRMQDR